MPSTSISQPGQTPRQVDHLDVANDRIGELTVRMRVFRGQLEHFADRFIAPSPTPVSPPSEPSLPSSLMGKLDTLEQEFDSIQNMFGRLTP